jgi:hypothetical protein
MKEEVEDKADATDLGLGRPLTLTALLRIMLPPPYSGSGRYLSTAGRNPTFHRPREVAAGKQV